jgi:putative SOS response-associated peptidase YedK
MLALCRQVPSRSSAKASRRGECVLQVRRATRGAPVSTHDLIAAFVAAGGDPADWAPSWSIAPQDSAPIIRERIHDDTVIRFVDVAQWGLTPSWSKPGMPKPINARIEKLTTSGMYTTVLKSTRAVGPISPGYIKWVKAEDGGKQPYLIHGNGEILAAAGLYTRRRDTDTGEWGTTYTIITRDARDASGEIHDRMPAFLTPDVWDQWLTPEPITDAEAAVAMLTDVSDAVAATLTSYPISRTVNIVRTVDRLDSRILDPITMRVIQNGLNVIMRDGVLK